MATKNNWKFNQALHQRLCKLESELAARSKALKHIFNLNSALVSCISAVELYAMVTRVAQELTHTDMCVLRLYNNDKNVLEVVSQYCRGKDFIRELPEIKIGEGLSGKVAKAQKPSAVYDISLDRQLRQHKIIRSIGKEGIKGILAVPVVYHNGLLGVITAYSIKPRYFTQEEINIFQVFASYVAVSIREAEHRKQINLNYFNTICSLVLSLENRDPYAHGHTERVTQYAMALGSLLNLSVEELEALRFASEVHDIGKISIPDFILNKPGALSKVERSIIELHPVKGAEILAPLEFLKQVIPIVRHHHERYDGKGYPDGLARKNIPLLARIIACADSFDAMTSERPYRKGKLSTKEALKEITKNAGAQFDPKIAAIFIRLIKEYNKNKKTSLRK